MQIYKLILSLFAYLLICFLALPAFFAYSEAMAQAISLSISPPLFEAVIQPGKTVKQTYTISSDGNITNLTPKIVYFTVADEIGNINLSNTSAPDWVKFNKESSILTISPPENTPETDHFLTLVFESKAPVDLLNENTTSYVSQIGSNILLTISKDGRPKKSAEIVKFSTPKIVDSIFGKINYIVSLKNNGNSFWKPIGKIVTKNEVLNLAPQNVISDSTRKILCLENESLVDCRLQNEFRIGKITSKLEFSIDDDPKIYKTEIVTYAVPFSLILVLIGVFAIFNVWRRRK